MQNINCLLIEDNPADAFLIREMLNPGGNGDYRVTLSDNLESSVKFLNEENFDFIISDLSLPDSNGLDTVKLVANKIKHLPIIVLTGNDNEQVGNEALSIGAQDYLIKGTINSDQLLRSIRYAFRRKKIEANLRESEEKFRTMVETSPDAVITLDSKGKILYASKRAAEVHGYSDEKDLIGKELRGLFVENERGKIRKRLDEIRETGVIRDEEYIMLRDDNSIFYGELSVSSIKNDKEENVGYLLVAKDITERKNQENAIKLYQKSLRSLTTQLNLAEEKERRKIAVELHDHLGQSLAMAKIRLAVFKNGKLSAGSIENLQEVERHISHAIDYSRILTYELSPPVLFELGLVEALNWKLEQISENTGIKTSMEIKQNIPPLTDDFLILIFRSFSELVNNVVKHSAASYLSVIVFHVGKIIILRVEDNGTGFNPEFLNHSEHSHKMGLFSIRERLEYFDGNLKIDSRKGEGTKIELSVPVRYK